MYVHLMSEAQFENFEQKQKEQASPEGVCLKGCWGKKKLISAEWAKLQTHFGT